MKREEKNSNDTWLGKWWWLCCTQIGSWGQRGMETHRKDVKNLPYSRRPLNWTEFADEFMTTTEWECHQISQHTVVPRAACWPIPSSPHPAFQQMPSDVAKLRRRQQLNFRRHSWSVPVTQPSTVRTSNCWVYCHSITTLHSFFTGWQNI